MTTHSKKNATPLDGNSPPSPPGKIKIANALSKLLEEKDFDSITTTETAKTSEVLKSYISSQFSDEMTELDTGRYDLMYEVKPGQLLEVAKALRDDEKLKFDFLCNLGGTDTKENFEVVYNITSMSLKHRLDFKLILPYENAEVDSVQEIWPAANWYEREMWELYGINVKNHDNLKRFLLPDDWDQGHPMRKDWDAPDFVRFPEM